MGLRRETVAIRTAPNGAQDKSRVALVRLLNLNLRLMESWRHTQSQLIGYPLDCESTLILMAIVAIGADKLMTTSALADFEDLQRPIDLSLLKKCTLSSIAATTSINRETVRRKVGQLVKLGLVARVERAEVRIAEGVLQRPEISAGVEQQLRSLAYAVNQLKRDGIFQFSPQY